MAGKKRSPIDRQQDEVDRLGKAVVRHRNGLRDAEAALEVATRRLAWLREDPAVIVASRPDVTVDGNADGGLPATEPDAEVTAG